MTLEYLPARVLALCLLTSSVVHADPTDDFIRAQMKAQNIPGLALAVVKDGTVIKAQGYGVADRKSNTPAAVDTVFKIGSVSKQFVAAAIMLLVQDERLTLNDLVRDHLPGTPASWSAITIRHLLSHTAGLVREPPGFDPFKTQSVEELIATTYGEPLRFTPGERWEYSNLGYNVLAAIISRTSGQPWSEFIAARLFRPAGMLATRTTTTEPVANRAVGYSDNNKLIEAEDWPAVRPGGAFLSTVLDLAKWDAVLYTDAILTESSRREMWSAIRLNGGASYPYGLGWYVNRPGQRAQVYHGGGLPGFIAQFRRYVDDRLSVIVLLNLDDADDEAVAFGVAELYLPDRK